MAGTSKLIITAASEGFAGSLFALLGSLNVNWPGHPPVLVYDIGLSDQTLQKLTNYQIPVRQVPPFCPHWRKHYTWKFWCFCDAPADHVLWLDAGVAILAPLDEIFESISRIGYFTVPNYHGLMEQCHPIVCYGCGVQPEFRHGKHILATGLVGMDKSGKIHDILDEALTTAQNENYIATRDNFPNKCQGIFSILMYKYFRSVVLSDGLVYLGWVSPKQTLYQKVWAHRRNMEREDIEYFSQYVVSSGPPYQPQIPRDGIMWYIRRPGHVWTKIKEKGIMEASKWGTRIILTELGWKWENQEKLRMGLRD